MGLFRLVAIAEQANKTVSGLKSVIIRA